MDSELAARWGLECVLIRSCRRTGTTAPDFWLIRSMHDHCDLGSWVPATGSARVGPRMYTGLRDGSEVLALFIAYNRSRDR